MERKNLYIIVAVVAIVVLVLALNNLTGKSILGTHTQGCSETDNGKDEFVKGIIGYKNRAYTYTDYCFSKGGIGSSRIWINEYYCFSDKIVSKEIECENKCENGACVR